MLDPPSLLDFRSAVKTFDKLERLRRDEEAKVCHLLISSFSEEAKMLLRSVPTFNDNDSFAMYRNAKESHTCASSFAVAQSTFHQLLSIKKTGTFALTDALLNHRRTFAAIVDPTATGTEFNALQDSEFQFMKDKLYSEDLKIPFQSLAKFFRP